MGVGRRGGRSWVEVVLVGVAVLGLEVMVGRVLGFSFLIY